MPLSSNDSATSRKRKFYLTCAYGGIFTTLLYNYVLFNAVNDALALILTDVFDVDHEQTPWRIAQLTVISSFCLCNFVADSLAVNPVELAYNAAQPRQKKTRPEETVRGLPVTLFLGGLAFLSGSSYVLLGLEELFGEDKAGLIASYTLGSVYIFFAVSYFILLSGEDLIKHHRVIYGGALSAKLASVYDKATKDFSATFEIFLQILNNSFYRAISFSFLVGSVLRLQNSKNPIVNLSILGVVAFSAAYQTLFSRFTYARSKYYSKKRRNAFEWRSDVLSQTFANHLLFGLFRAFGMVYITSRYVAKSPLAKWLAGGIVGLVMIAHTVVISQQQRRATKVSTETIAIMTSRKPVRKRGLLSLANLAARSLRLVGVAGFILTLNDFLAQNDVVLDIKTLDALMISIAFVSIEASNFVYYQSKMNEIWDYYCTKYQALEQFSWRTLFYSTESEVTKSEDTIGSTLSYDTDG